MGQGASTSSTFKSALNRLLTEPIAETDESFWGPLWKLNTNPELYFVNIQAEQVRALLQDQPGNLATMVDQAVSQLSQIVRAPMSKYYGQALNCVRLLTRLVPPLLAAEADGSEFVTTLFWGDARSLLEERKDQGEGEEGKEEDGPLAARLLDAVAGLLFLPDFSVSLEAYTAAQVGDNAPRGLQPPQAALLWSAGIGYPDVAPREDAKYDSNREEVLKLLICCLSDALFQAPATYSPTRSKWLLHASSAVCPHAASIFYSLINIVLAYDPVGWGVPYGGAVSAQNRERLLDVSLQTLLVLLDYGGPSAGAPPPPPPADGDAPPPPPTGRINVFRLMFSNVTRASDLDILYHGIARLLSNVHESQNTYLPGSLAQVECYQEVLILLWKLLDENQAFLMHVLRTKDVSELVVPILFLMYDGRRDSARVGLLHLCTFILLLLSGERDFGVALNKPFRMHLPLDLPLFTGSHADLLMIVLHKLVVNGTNKLETLYNCFLTIMCNVSPYTKTLCLVSAVKLLNLFELFTSPRFLYASEANHHFLFLLLDLFNNLVQYQYQGSINVVYALLRRKEAIERLASLTLPRRRPAGSVPPSVAAEAKLEEGEAKLEEGEGQGQGQGEGAAEAEVPQAGAGEEEQSRTATSGQQTGTDILNPEAPAPEAAEDGRWVPTQEWLDSWKTRLPLATLLRLVQHLVPRVESLVKGDGSVDEVRILEFLSETTMVGLLPVPHSIVCRKYQPNQFTATWFTTYLHGVVFLRHQTWPLVDGATIKLFTINVV